MKTVSIADLRQNPTPALDAVEAGESVLITRYRKPIAEINPHNVTRLPQRAPSGRQIMDAVNRLSKLTETTWGRDVSRCNQDATENWVNPWTRE